MNTQHLSWLRRLALAGLLLGLAVVVFGAYVRLTYAGLGCPDWPGCFGHVTPLGAQDANAGTLDTPLHMGKAWREMTPEQRASYPFRFALRITHALVGGRLVVTHAVTSREAPPRAREEREQHARGERVSPVEH
jgi:hypothetical protein